MFRNKLCALEHPAPDSVDCSDRAQFASTVLWLEDQKIRLYTIQDRDSLRDYNKNTTQWENIYEKYKKDVGVPKCENTEQELSWLLGHAIRLEYLDNVDKFKSCTAESVLSANRPTDPMVTTTNIFDTMNMSTNDFQNGISALAKRLNIPHHPDHMIVLQAASRLIHDKLRPDALNESPPIGKPYSVTDHNNGKKEFDDKDLNQAAKILRLLQIQAIRRLQTSINETIVGVQELTADPRTDTKLGKVGF